MLAAISALAALAGCACMETEPALAPAKMEAATGELAKGTKPFQGIPSIATTASGKRQFLAWYGNGATEMAGNYIMVSYADNNQWKNKVDMVVRPVHPDKVRCFDPSVWRSPSGDIWLFWAQAQGLYRLNKQWDRIEDSSGQYDRRGGVWFSVCKNPEADVPQWSAPKRLCDGVMMNKPIVLANGKWAFPVCEFQMDNINDLKSLDEGAALYISDPEAKNVKRVNNVKVPFSPFTEHSFVERRDGSLWLLTRIHPNHMTAIMKSADKHGMTSFGNSGIWEAFSYDGGKTFGRLAPADIPHCGSRFFIYRMKSGNLVLVKNETDDAQWLAGKPRGQQNLRVYPRKGIAVYLSEDDGKTWKGGLMLDDKNGVSYPDASQDDEGYIYVCHDYSRYDKRKIYVSKITEADILAKKIVSAKSEPAKSAEAR